MKTLLVLIGLTACLTAPVFGSQTLSLKLEPDRNVVLKGPPQEVVVKINLSAASASTRRHRSPLNLAVVLDRSGSMAGPKLEKARQAAEQLVDRLQPDDVFSLVTFSSTVDVLVAAQHVEDKAAIKQRIREVEAGGQTALFGGVSTGADQIREFASRDRINRIILLSDGLANVGPSSTPELRRLGQTLAAQGMVVTTIGVGNDYNEDLMAGLAEASDANYYYVQDTEKLPEIFAREMGELLTVAARDVRIEITCPEGVKPLGFIGRGERFENQKAVVRLSQFAPGQSRCLFLRCLTAEGQPQLAEATLSYTDELDDGRLRSVSGTASIQFTTDGALAAQSANAAIIAEKDLVLTALIKDAALADADAHNYHAAAAKLRQQAAELDSRVQSVQPDIQNRLQAEIQNLRDRGNQIDQGQYDAATRKAMQSESYNTRNSQVR